nr:disease resistance protein TAO1-like [Ipomoea trifida]
MSVSKDIVPQDLWSNGAVGCSSANYTSPLFFKKKRIFIVVMISGLFHNWHLFEYASDGSERSFKNSCEYNDKGLECRVYDHFTEPNKVEEVEVVIELNPSSVEQGAKENLIIQTCIVHEEEEDDKVCFYPMNPVIKFHQPNRSTLHWWESAVITIKHRSRSPEGSSLKQGHTVMDKDLFIEIKQRSSSLQALLQNPNCREWLKMSVSKDMVSKYLCSNNEVAGCSSNYSLPLFLKKKGIFIVVEILCLFRLQFLDYKMIGTELIYPDDDMEVRCTVYNLFTEPNKFQEVEELIELHSSSEQRWKKRSILQTCIVYEEQGEVYFIPMNPNVVIKFHPESTDNEITGMEREQQNEGTCIWDALCLHPLFRCEETKTLDDEGLTESIPSAHLQTATMKTMVSDIDKDVSPVQEHSSDKQAFIWMCWSLFLTHNWLVPGERGHNLALTKFFNNIVDAFLKHIDFNVICCAVIASPGFTKVQALKDFFNMLSNDPDRACYGPKHVEVAHERMAIQTLLITFCLHYIDVRFLKESLEFPDYVTPSLVVNRAILGFHNSCSSTLGQLQGLCQGGESVANFLGRAQGLRPEFRPLVAMLTAKGEQVTLTELLDFLGGGYFSIKDIVKILNGLRSFCAQGENEMDRATHRNGALLTCPTL